MLSPRKIKYRKVRKGRNKGEASRGTTVSFGEHGLRALEPARLSARQIEATRRAIIRRIRKLGSLWIRVFPDTPVTSKPTEVRMGKGKGSLDRWVAKVKPGRILYEVGGVPPELAKKALESGSYKLPIKTRFVSLK
jgi:large subunit ribosomal protein L16